jgi:hydroxyethylthiazole kinase-like uncharacterized protein yjeF
VKRIGPLRLDERSPHDDEAVVVDPRVLSRHPLPATDGATTKHERGIVVVVGGTVETPGATVLAGVAALRAGAGKLQILTVEPHASAVAVAVPEARVVGLPVRDEEVDASALADCDARLAAADAVLVGTGCLDPARAAALRREVLRRVQPHAIVIVDAAALPAANEAGELRSSGSVVVMPNPAEAAQMLRVEPADVEGDPRRALTALVDGLHVFVTVRHAETWTGGPGTGAFVDRVGHPSLATSGSGDVLGGVLAGLAARGADPLAAMLWAVHVHGHAGIQAAQRVGGDGVLARELSDEVPTILAALARS